MQDPGFDSLLKKLQSKKDLDSEEAGFCMHEIMHGNVSPDGMASFLTLLKEKGETVEEITAFAKIMRGSSLRVNFHADYMVDTCGTGGDGGGTFNVSTCCAFVAAGAGTVVAKHGNRKASSQSGSMDVLEKLGVPMAASQGEAEQQLAQAGITFMFAPAFHPAIKNIAPVRRALGFKTVFNVLGPLCNPAQVKRQVIGVYAKALIPKVAGALGQLGTQKAMVVCSDTDEISISSQTSVAEVVGTGRRGNGNGGFGAGIFGAKARNTAATKEYKIYPQDFGFKMATLQELAAASPEGSAKRIMEVLSGNAGPARDIVLLNSGAAIYVSGKAGSLKQGILLAEKSIDSGKAMEKLDALRAFSAPAGK